MSDSDIRKAAQDYVAEPILNPEVPAPAQDQNQNSAGVKSKAKKTSDETLLSPEALTVRNSQVRSLIETRFPAGLSQFGYDNFRAVAVSFIPLKNASVGSDYVLGAGDQINVNMWGTMQQSFYFDVDTDGNVYLPKIGRFSVAGMTIGQAKIEIQHLFEKNFANFYLDITLGKLKTIEVFVLGEVTLPGRYNLNSLSTVLYALYSAGGPTKAGSLRKIQIIRDQRLYKTVDLYDLLLNGDKTCDSLLKKGDTVFVPKIGEVVAIQGDVKSPGIFEITEGTNLYDLVAMAGKFTRTTYIKEMNLIQKDNLSDTLRLRSLSFKSIDDFITLAKKVDLSDGDVLEIKSTGGKLDNWVKIKGNIRFPGMYDYSRASNVDKLMKLAGGTLDPVYHIDVSRTNVTGGHQIQEVPVNQDLWANVLLSKFDEVTVYSQKEMIIPSNVMIYGMLKHPGTFPFEEGLTIKQLIVKCGGLSVEQDKLVDITIARVTEAGLTEIQLVSENTHVLADDQIFVSAKAANKIEGTITLEGEFVRPGVYPVVRGETYLQLIERVGGYTGRAFLPGVAIYRKIPEDKLVPALSKESGMVSSSYMESIISMADFTRLRINLSKVNENQENDFPLLNGDRIVADLMPHEVKVVGAVYNQGLFLYEPNKTLGYYLMKAGNFRKDADPAEMFIAHVDGTVSRTSDQGYPIAVGDSIGIPVREIREVDWLKSLLDWTQVIFNVATVWKVVFG
ncbi:MAG: SLBB domain-containing protein, partial [Candidatus Margulisiibacteriota bacterium]